MKALNLRDKTKTYHFVQCADDDDQYPIIELKIMEECIEIYIKKPINNFSFSL